jgi:hypothetical protein
MEGMIGSAIPLHSLSIPFILLLERLPAPGAVQLRHMLPYHFLRRHADEGAARHREEGEVVDLPQQRHEVRQEVKRADAVHDGAEHQRLRKPRNPRIAQQSHEEADEVREVPDEAQYVPRPVAADVFPDLYLQWSVLFR